MEGYSEKVMEHFRNPRNVGTIENPDGVGHVGNPVCGDIMELYIKVENNIIVDAKFKTFGCLPANEEVVLSKGGWEKSSNIRKGTKVINSEGNQTYVIETYIRNYTGKLYKIVPFVSPFNCFSVTPEHPILCIKREWVKGARHYGQKCDWLRVEEDNLFSTNPDFVKARQLSEGDYLIFNVNRKVKNNTIFTEDVMRLMGYYLSEGYISAQGSVVAFSFNKKENKLIKEVTILLQKIVGKKPKTRIRDNVAEVYICSRKLVRFLTYHCKKIARDKSLSEDVLLLPFSKQWEMIETYLYGDGDRYRRRSHNSQTYRIITTSKLLAIQMQEMLARGGIFASIRQIFKTDCYIGDRKLKDSVQYLLSLKLNRFHKFAHYNSRYFLIPIKKIYIENFRGPVYNFQVYNEPNAYLVKGFAVHNCGAAIATSSMVTELVKGKTVDEALKISNKAVAEALGGLPPIKMHCSLLAEEALKSAIEDYLKKSSQR
jgi:NifU-like protein involved in Fe-S cluster formation